MKQKHNHFKLNRYMLGTIVFLVVLVTTFTIVAIKHSRTNATPTVKEAVGAAVPSQFTFTGATGWWQGATRMEDMALFDGNDTHACFVSVQHNSGIVDVAAELKRIDSQVASYDSGRTVSQIGIKTLTIQTPSGPKQYDLHQSVVIIPPGTEPVKTGQEFGYLQLTDGYLKIMGYCDTPDQLQTTIAPLQAIKFDATKSKVIK